MSKESRMFFRLFCRFKQTLQFLPQINVKNVHPVYGAGQCDQMGILLFNIYHLQQRQFTQYHKNAKVGTKFDKY